MNSDICANLESRHRDLLNERQSWEPGWKELARHFAPMRCRLEYDQWQTNQGGELRPQALESVAFYAARDLAAGLQGGMTSPSRPWFGLAVNDQRLAKSGRVRAWLDETCKRMREVLHGSNFYNAVYNVYHELGVFGTAFMFAVPDERTLVRFIPLTAGEYCIDVDERGRVDTVFRTVSLTLRQLALEFGLENLPESLRLIYEAGNNLQLRCRVVHAVFPADGAGGRGLGASGGVGLEGRRPYASVYYLREWGRSAGSGGSGPGEAGAVPHILRRSGFGQFPGFGVRWTVIGGDIYGRSPAMDALPDSRLLQQIKVSMLRAIHKELDPPMVAPPGLENLRLIPGAVNIINPNTGGNGPQVYPAANVRHNIEAAYSVARETAESLKRGMYNDLFRMISDMDRRQVTAREISARESEKMLLIGPVLERLQDELFIPLVDRIFYLMAEAGRLPDWPDELSEQPLRVEFVSILAQAQKQAATGAIEQTSAFIGQLARIKPEALDALDVDNIVDGYAEATGLEADMLTGKDEREALRASRVEQQAQAEQMQQGMAAVEAMQKLGVKAQGSDVGQEA